MSWKCSTRYWRVGPFACHVYLHALDPKQRRFYELSIGGHDWQVWPPRRVLNPENEWTMESRADVLATIAHCLRLLKREPRQ